MAWLVPSWDARWSWQACLQAAPPCLRIPAKVPPLLALSSAPSPRQPLTPPVLLCPPPLCLWYRRFQLERLGYFCADPDSTPGALVLNRTCTLKARAGGCAHAAGFEAGGHRGCNDAALHWGPGTQPCTAQKPPLLLCCDSCRRRASPSRRRPRAGANEPAARAVRPRRCGAACPGLRTIASSGSGSVH